MSARGEITIRPIQPADDAAIAAIIRAVMPEFGAVGSGFAISDPEVDWMSRAYAAPRHAYFVVELDGVVRGGGGVLDIVQGDRALRTGAGDRRQVHTECRGRPSRDRGHPEPVSDRRLFAGWGGAPDRRSRRGGFPGRRRLVR